MTIEKKLYSSFGASLAVTLLMGYVAISNIGKLGDDLSNIGHRSVRCLYLTGDINKLTSDFLAEARGVLLSAHLHDAEAMRRDQSLAQTDAEQIKKESAELALLTSSQLVSARLRENVEDQIDPLMQGLTETYETAMKGDLPAAEELWVKKYNATAVAVSDAGEELLVLELKVVTDRVSLADDRVGPARTLSMLMILLALIVGAVVIWIVKSITTSLRASVTELSDGADQTANAASQISSSSQSLAQGASEQAASLEETSASAEQINSMARKNTDNSRATAELLSQSQQKVSQANRMLEDMVTSMNQITESSGKISKIIKVIDEIAFQTNILALNAAVEAARAGEAGMGFAVVADEVRSLAQRSAQAAKDTAVLIEDSIAKSNEGKSKVDQVAAAIQAVTEDSSRVKVMVDEVSLGSEEQTRGIDQIGRAISQMEQVTQTTAASAEESAAAAEELNAQSDALKDLVSRLQQMIGGDQRLSSYPLHSVTRTPVKVALATRRSLPKTLARSREGVSPSTYAGNAAAHTARKPTPAEEFPLEESFQSF